MPNGNGTPSPAAPTAQTHESPDQSAPPLPAGLRGWLPTLLSAALFAFVAWTEFKRDDRDELQAARDQALDSRLETIQVQLRTNDQRLNRLEAVADERLKLLDRR